MISYVPKDGAQVSYRAPAPERASDLGLRTLEAGTDELRRRIEAPVSGCTRIAVMSRKGGVGKTTTAVMLGHVLASHREDRVIALDCSSEGGTLGHRFRRGTGGRLHELVAHASEIQSHADVRRFTASASSRLEVVAATDESLRSGRVDGEHVRRLVALIEPFYGVACLDTGQGLSNAATAEVLAASDQVIVVVAPTAEGLRTARTTFDWVRESGRSELAVRSIAVINNVVPSLAIDMDDLSAQLGTRFRTVVSVPFDRHLVTGAEVLPARVAPTTRRAYLELAATVADGFSAAHS